MVLRQPFVADGAINSLDIGFLCGGFPGWMYSNWMRHSCAYCSRVSRMFSGPLSHRSTLGLQRQPMICFKALITRCEGNEKSTSMPSASRLNSSMKLNSRKLRPSANLSCMMSMDQTWLLRCGTANASGLSRTCRLRGLMR